VSGGLLDSRAALALLVVLGALLLLSAIARRWK
jgi:hypothetical protein